MGYNDIFKTVLINYLQIFLRIKEGKKTLMQNIILKIIVLKQ